jgi:O-antigen/teichoic acid export membrane protein
MLLVLSLGGGIPQIALAYLGGNTALQIVRVFVGYRCCPELRLRMRYASWPVARKMLAFGMKGTMNKWSRLVLVQANAILVTWVLGPAALAIYARPIALVRHVETLVNKLSFVLTPTTSSLQASRRSEEIQELTITGTRVAVALILPALLLLGILGNQILQLWMGTGYVRGDVLAIVAVGYFLPLAQQPAASVLRGLNRHGALAIVGSISATIGIALGYLLVSVWQLELIGAALAVALPLTLGNGLFIALHVCRSLEIPVRSYFRRTCTLPALCCMPFTAALLMIRGFYSASPLTALSLGAAAGALLVAPLYWRFLIPGSLKTKLQQRWAGVGIDLKLRRYSAGADDAAQS